MRPLSALATRAPPTMCAASYARLPLATPWPGWNIPRHENLLVVVAASVFAASRLPDKVTLSNGDVVTGKVVSMADGKVTVRSPVMGDVVSLVDVKDMVTGAPVTHPTTAGSGRTQDPGHRGCGYALR